MKTARKFEKKVLFLICASHLKAGGGHFYSLSTLMKALQESVETKVINIGLVKVETLPEQDVLGFVPIFKYSIFCQFVALYRLVKRFGPDVYHAFDERSLYVAKILSLLIRKPVVYTKCGGPNGSKYIPFANVSIFFSAENQKHYLKYRSFSGDHYLIPNRSLPIQQDFARLEELKQKIGHFSGVTILRISRFNRYYERTFQQCLRLLQSFNASGYKARLILLGKKQDAKYFNELKNEKVSNGVIFITDEKFTQNASELLGVADVVVGTGRGVMEAASLSKPIYCPNGASTYPVLLNKERIKTLLIKNFSERYYEETSELELSLDGTDSADAFKKYFDIGSAIDQYEMIYNNVVWERQNLIDLIKGGVWFFRP